MILHFSVDALESLYSIDSITHYMNEKCFTREDRKSHCEQQRIKNLHFLCLYYQANDERTMMIIFYCSSSFLTFLTPPHIYTCHASLMLFLILSSWCIERRAHFTQIYNLNHIDFNKLFVSFLYHRHNLIHVISLSLTLTSLCIIIISIFEAWKCSFFIFFIFPVVLVGSFLIENVLSSYTQKKIFAIMWAKQSKASCWCKIKREKRNENPSNILHKFVVVSMCDNDEMTLNE